jgi:Phosphotransferase system, mannose/fructose/N-acetylgalactosamine-specific component IIB
MIKLLRVDDRLIHGQVAVSWTSFLGADTIVVANNKAATDQLMQMAFQMAKPPQAVLSIKSLDGAVAVLNNPKHAARNIFVITESLQDAVYLAERCGDISSVCLGGIRKAAGKKMIECQVYLSNADYQAMKQLQAMGKEVYLQPVPTGKRLSCEDIDKEYLK